MGGATLYAYDAAYAPNLAAVKAAGGIAINGYLTGDYANTTTQPQLARRAGLGYIATYEEGRSELVGATRATGRRVGDKIAAAFKRLSLPLDGSIAVYPSVDVAVPIDGNDRDADQCNTGWEGIRDVIDGDISVRSYAEGAIIDALATAGLVDGKCWLAAPTSWPGYNVNDANVCMVQLVGTNVPGTDRNHLITDPRALGAWWPDNSPYTGGILMDDATLTARFDRIEAHLTRQDARVTSLFQVDVNGDGKPDLTGTVQGSVFYAIRDLQASVRATQQIVADLPTRVASLQKAVDTLAPAIAAVQTAVAAIKPADVALDTAAVVAGVVAGVVDGIAAKLPAFPALADVADAVAARVKTLSWKAAE